MSTRAYSGSVINRALTAYARGATQESVAKTLGCSTSAIGGWRFKYGGMTAHEIDLERRSNKEMERLRRANRQLVAERNGWQAVIRVLKIPLSQRLLLFNQLTEANLVSINQARRLLKTNGPNSLKDIKYERDDAIIIQIMRAHLANNPGHGFDTMFHQILQGKVCGYIRGRRLYSLENLQQFVRNRKRLVSKRHDKAVPKRLEQAAHVNDTWSIDFMHIQLRNGAPLRSLNVIDDYSRECLLIRGSHTTRGTAVVDHLQEVIARCGKPNKIRCDNGPEFTSDVFHGWAKKEGIVIEHTEPYKSWQNAYIERFNRSFRHDVLRWDTFLSLNHFDATAEAYRLSYNNVRPHKSLGWRTPAEAAASPRNHKPRPTSIH